MARRDFLAHCDGEPPTRAHPVEGVNFEDAALAFVEDWHPAPDDGDEVSVIVEDRQSGERQCFRINLDTGAAQPCA